MLIGLVEVCARIMMFYSPFQHSFELEPVTMLVVLGKGETEDRFGYINSTFPEI